jgi:hypothetical protein
MVGKGVLLGLRGGELSTHVDAPLEEVGFCFLSSELNLHVVVLVVHKKINVRIMVES